MIIAAPSVDIPNDVKDMLKQKFNVKDLGKLSYFLGINFGQTEGVVTMNQNVYLNEILERLEMSECELVHVNKKLNMTMMK